MPWRNLGSIKPDYLQFKEASNPAFGELFRVSQSWNGTWPGTGFIHLTANYYDGGTYGIVKIYPALESRLIILPHPQEFLDAGITIRHFSARLSSRNRMYQGHDWTIYIDEFTGVTDLNDNPIQFIDGGTY